MRAFTGFANTLGPERPQREVFGALHCEPPMDGAPKTQLFPPSQGSEAKGLV
jgi:hypothetical protein